MRLLSLSSSGIYVGTDNISSIINDITEKRILSFEKQVVISIIMINQVMNDILC